MIHKATPEAIKLFMDGQLALAECRRVGMRIDYAKLNDTIVKVEKNITNLERELREDKVGKQWRKKYGDKMNFGSRDQLADILFNDLGFKTEYGTASNRRQSTNKTVLEQIDIPFVNKYLRIEPMKKALSTNLVALRRFAVERDGMHFVYPNIALNTTVTTRSSAFEPNTQNFPKRNPDIAEMVRSIFIARPHCYFAEPDLSQIEVRVPAALTGDQELRRYIMDPNSDMHRDQAKAVYKLKTNQVTKRIRQTVKGAFVFATFYGSPYYNTCKELWDFIDIYDLKLDDGTPLKEHLKSKGITHRGLCDKDQDPADGSFEKHLQSCERKLWNRFHGYDEWKQRQVAEYHRTGGMVMATGFAITGIHSRTEIANYGIQGPAFHCCLWALIRLVKRLRKYKMRSLVLGEIHDSIQLDIYHKELQDVLEMAYQIMTQEMPKHFSWLGDIPIESETDVSPKNGSWHECKTWQREEFDYQIGWSLKA